MKLACESRALLFLRIDQPSAQLARRLVLLSPLALGDVTGQTLEAHEAPFSVEWGARGWREARVPAGGAYEARGDRIRRAAGADTAHQGFEARAVVRMDPRKEGRAGNSLLRIEPQDLRDIFAVPRQIGADIPLERRDRPGRQRFLQSRFALLEHGLVLTPLGEKRSKNERADRHSQDGGLGAQDAVVHRETGVAEMPDAEGDRPNDREGHDERSPRGEDRPATSRKPQQEREQ